MTYTSSSRRPIGLFGLITKIQRLVKPVSITYRWIAQYLLQGDINRLKSVFTVQNIIRVPAYKLEKATAWLLHRWMPAGNVNPHSSIRHATSVGRRHDSLLVGKIRDHLLAPRSFFLSLSFSPPFLVEEAGHSPNPFQEVQRRSGSVTNRRLWTPRNQITGREGGCGALLGRWRRRRAAGDRCQWSPRRFHHEKVAAQEAHFPSSTLQ